MASPMLDPGRWERVQALFHKVVDLGHEEQLRVLREECAKDSELMEEVLRLLRSDAGHAGLLDAGLAEVADQVLSSSPAPGIRKLGPWEIRHVLGEGGMGSVFFAVRPDLGTSAAIKVLRDSWLSPARRERFAREQRMLAHLEHPNIARLLDAGTLDDGTPWIVMEYVEGRHFDDYCDANTLGLAERLRLFRSVCEAVQFAHGRAVIHRDLKPSNVLVGPGGAVKLLDFGVARQLAELGDDADLTRTGLRLLTPAFAAPEQLRGEPPSVAADVYSLGVILYRLLTGRLPFDVHHDPADIAQLAMGRDFVRPSLVGRRVSQAEGGPSVRVSRSEWHDLDVICGKAMHNDTRQRYASCEALIRDIDHFLAGEPVEARPDSVRYKLRKFTQRHRSAISVTAALLVAAGALIALFTVRLTQERNAALAEAARTQRMQQFILRLFDGGDRDAGPSHDLLVSTLLKSGVAEAQALDQDPEIQAEMYESLGGIYRKLGDLPQAEKLLLNALEKRQADGSLASIAGTKGALALLRTDQARLDEAEQLAREALDIGRLALPPNHPKLAAATEGLGHVLLEKGDYAEAITVLQDAVQQRTAGEHSASELAGAMYVLSNAYFYAGRYKESEELNRKVLAINQELYGERHPRVAEVLVNLGAIQFDLGNYAESEKYHRQALEITRSFLGENHYRTAAGLTLLARSLVYQKKYDEAVPLLRNALSIQEQVFGQVHPRVASAVNELGTVALQKGDPATAKALYQRMLDIYQSVYPGGHYRIGTATSNLASAYFAAKEYPTAEKLFRKAIGVFTKTLSADHLNTGIARIKLGRTLLREKRYTEAQVETEAGIAILGNQVNPSVTWLNAARADLLEIQRGLGKNGQELTTEPSGGQ